MEDLEAIDAYVRWMVHQRSSPATTTSKYRNVLLAFMGHIDTPLSNRTVADVEHFTQRPRRGGGEAANSTIAVEVSIVGMFYRWGQARFDWATNPAALAGRPKVHNDQPRPVDHETWRQLWGCPRLEDDARVALGLGYFCGFRRAETMALRGTNVWGRHVVNFERKGGGKSRFDVGNLLDHWAHFRPDLLIHTDLLERPLRRLAQAAGEGRILDWPRDPTAFNKRMAQWLVSAGLPCDECTPHMLRHSFATNLCGTDVPLEVVTALCNHQSTNTTMRYVDAAGERLAAMRVRPRRVYPMGATNA